MVGKSFKKAEETFKGNRYLDYLAYADGFVSTVYVYVKTYQIIYFEYVQFIIIHIPQ